MVVAVLGLVALAVLVALAAIALFVYAFARPSASRNAERAVDKPLATAQHSVARAPGRLGGWLAKPFTQSRKATRKSAEAGRETRKKTSG